MPGSSEIIVFAVWATIALLAAAIVGFFVARYFRNWSHTAESPDGAPFTLQDLRRMRASGQITESEYETMRTAIIGHLAPRRTAGPRARTQSSPPPDAPDISAPPSD